VVKQVEKTLHWIHAGDIPGNSLSMLGAKNKRLIHSTTNEKYQIKPDKLIHKKVFAFAGISNTVILTMPTIQLF